MARSSLEELRAVRREEREQREQGMADDGCDANGSGMSSADPLKLANTGEGDP
jgi:hypothetical protein